ncbi:MAG: Crp/Fnr family transcriptional regulator [Thiotrichaceae bacterium]|nr:Crp/Fnr family transcriptional regulator [Thiotrichaceae bacterium]PCI12423.1 MAG: Crp/Fnr family transcriptional regulator [Thiotrichales bacterium]
MIERDPLFSELSSDDISLIASYGKTLNYRKHSIIINKGDESNCLYIVQQGRVKVYVSDEYGAEIILRYEGPGEYFGELALVDEAPRSASVETLEDTRLTYISRASFEACLHDKPEISVKLIRAMITRIRSLTEELSDCALKTVYQRVRERLTKMSIEQDGKRVIPQSMTHQEIAGLVGSSREMVSRLMKKLQNGGYISVEKKHISILRQLPRNIP